MRQWIATFEEDSNGDLILLLPLDIEWEIDDTIRWVINEDGTISLINDSWISRKVLQT